MIDEKKVEEWAKKYANVYSSEYPEAYSFHDGFVKGIEWYKQNLWHDVGEEPYPAIVWIIMQTGKDSWEIVKHDGHRDDGQTWQNEAKKGHILRWCYIEDLLTPKDASRTRLRAMLYSIANKADEKKTMNQADCNRLSDIMPQEGGNL